MSEQETRQAAERLIDLYATQGCAVCGYGAGAPEFAALKAALAQPHEAADAWKVLRSEADRPAEWGQVWGTVRIGNNERLQTRKVFWGKSVGGWHYQVGTSFFPFSEGDEIFAWMEIHDPAPYNPEAAEQQD